MRLQDDPKAGMSPIGRGDLRSGGHGARRHIDGRHQAGRRDDPPVQLVFFRAIVGLLLVAPLIWRYRSEVFDGRQMMGHLGRVLCSTLSLSCNYAAIAALPLTLVTVIGFTRPFVILGLAAMLLGERILPGTGSPPLYASRACYSWSAQAP